ncbi:MAG: hypothetical protein JW840_07855 [Candidatus Thermoplasmatota archaeon]|nr:hypothetical protein [Candidatus Thermoplasmatota archaeon]
MNASLQYLTILKIIKKFVRQPDVRRSRRYVDIIDYPIEDDMEDMATFSENLQNVKEGIEHSTGFDIDWQESEKLLETQAQYDDGTTHVEKEFEEHCKTEDVKFQKEYEKINPPELILYDHRNHKRHRNHRNRKTTIELSLNTRDMLLKLGKKGDTYEDIILRLIRQKENL